MCCRSVLNVVVRCAEDLLEISSGLLIDGCLDSDDRSEVIEEKTLSRQKRQTVMCSETCSAVNQSLEETCVYDCFQAEGSEVQEEVRHTYSLTVCS